MKKLFSILIAVVMIFSFAFILTACETRISGRVAMVTDVGDIDDESFNQTTWEAVVDYCETWELDYDYYRPSADSQEARVEKIVQAIDEGASIVVCPGYLFETAIYEVQDEYPDVKFVLLDGEPHSDDYSDYKTADNVYCILFQEEQAGYLAGYAAVMDGERNLGFLGGMAVPAVQRFGFGYIQGIQDAATELNLANGAVNVWYGYAGTFGPDVAIISAMSGWYANGVDTVFACGGGIYLSVLDAIKASGNANAKLIGVDTNQQPAINAIANYASIKVLTSAMKGLFDATQTALDKFFTNSWNDIAGKTDTYGLNANDGGNEYVGLPTASGSWGFSTFKIEDYNAVVATLRNGTKVVNNDVATNINTWLTNATKITNKGYTASIL